jgi:uncharacterized membrane protein (UPF0127 family)
MAFDPRLRRVVLFGGRTPAGDAADLWSFNGRIWTRLSDAGAPDDAPASPAGGAGAGLATDPAGGGVILHGGAGDSGRTWRYAAKKWTLLAGPVDSGGEVASLPPGPGPRTDPAMAFDPQCGGVVLTGGATDPAHAATPWWVFRDDVWQAVSGAPGEGGREEITIGGRRFSLEVAADADAREQGLSNRAEIEPDGGMIFIYPSEADRRFWMAYCLTDIDIVFLDAAGCVTARHTMKKERPRGDVEPEWRYFARLSRYPSRRPAQFAIEFRPGTLEVLGVKVGDRLDLDVERLGKMAKD